MFFTSPQSSPKRRGSLRSFFYEKPTHTECGGECEYLNQGFVIMLIQ